MLIALLAGVSLLLSGCSTKPTAMAFIYDNTISAAAGRRQFAEEFTRQVVVGGCLGNGEIAIIELSATPHLIHSGPARRGRDVQKALRSLTQTPGKPNGGSDPATALELAEQWLSQPRFQGYRKMVVGWTDLRPDPEKQPGRSPRRFRDPLQFRWSRVSPELHLYGVPYDRYDEVLKVWERLPVVNLHLPGEQLEASHLGLQAKML